MKGYIPPLTPTTMLFNMCLLCGMKVSWNSLLKKKM
jgi:hypothetical protein